MSRLGVSALWRGSSGHRTHSLHGRAVRHVFGVLFIGWKNTKVRYRTPTQITNGAIETRTRKICTADTRVGLLRAPSLALFIAHVERGRRSAKLEGINHQRYTYVDTFRHDEKICDDMALYGRENKSRLAAVDERRQASPHMYVPH